MKADLNQCTMVEESWGFRGGLRDNQIFIFAIFASLAIHPRNEEKERAEKVERRENLGKADQRSHSVTKPEGFGRIEGHAAP